MSLLAALKSNMDRFIGGDVIIKNNAIETLKSNMDRFIVESFK